jgi:saccharopine dehydrogenase-like NADP-dependent oxidoreductase
MKVLVLGCGEMGSSAVKDLYEYGKFKEIIVATRSMEKVQRLHPELKGRPIHVSAHKLDISDHEQLVTLMQGCDVVVNCVGPNYKHEVNIARAAIKANVNLIDINDDYETTYKMLELDDEAKEAGIIIVLGLGASPGINNVFAKAASDQLEMVDEIHTTWVMSGADPGGLALSYHLLYSLSGRALTFQNGKMIEVESFVDGKERMEFLDPVGPLDVYHVGHPEPVTLSRVFETAKVVDDKATFHPPFVNDLIRNLGKMVREAGGPIRVNGRSIDPMDFAAAYFHQRCKSLKNIPKEGALRVDVKGKRNGQSKIITYTSSGVITSGTGTPASMGAQMLIEGHIYGKGVLAPEECVDWREFIKTIVSRQIGRLIIREQNVESD